MWRDRHRKARPAPPMRLKEFISESHPLDARNGFVRKYFPSTGQVAQEMAHYQFLEHALNALSNGEEGNIDLTRKDYNEALNIKQLSLRDLSDRYFHHHLTEILQYREGSDPITTHYATEEFLVESGLLKARLQAYEKALVNEQSVATDLQEGFDTDKDIEDLIVMSRVKSAQDELLNMHLFNVAKDTVDELVEAPYDERGEIDLSRLRGAVLEHRRFVYDKPGASALDFLSPSAEKQAKEMAKDIVSCEEGLKNNYEQLVEYDRLIDHVKDWEVLVDKLNVFLKTEAVNSEIHPYELKKARSGLAAHIDKGDEIKLIHEVVALMSDIEDILNPEKKRSL